MPHGSQAFRALERRVATLRRTLLGFLPQPPTVKVNLSDDEIDRTLAFILLVHAEIEEFVEAAVRAKLASAKTVHSAANTVTTAMRRAIAYWAIDKKKSWAEITLPSPDAVNSAYESFMGKVDSNHGIKRRNLAQLLYPIGVMEPSLDPDWLAKMDSFGEGRGNFAHRGIKAFQAPDPNDVLKTVEALLAGLLRLDRILSNIK